MLPDPWSRFISGLSIRDWEELYARRDSLIWDGSRISRPIGAAYLDELARLAREKPWGWRGYGSPLEVMMTRVRQWLDGRARHFYWIAPVPGRYKVSVELLRTPSSEHFAIDQGQRLVFAGQLVDRTSSWVLSAKGESIVHLKVGTPAVKGTIFAKVGDQVSPAENCIQNQAPETCPHCTNGWYVGLGLFPAKRCEHCNGENP